MKKYYFFLIALSVFFTKPSQEMKTPELVSFMTKMNNLLKDDSKKDIKQMDFVETLEQIYAYKEKKSVFSSEETTDYQAVVLKAQLAFNKLFPQENFPKNSAELKDFDEAFFVDDWDEDGQDSGEEPSTTTPHTFPPAPELPANASSITTANQYAEFFSSEDNVQMFLLDLGDFFSFVDQNSKKNDPAVTQAINLATQKAQEQFKKLLPTETFPTDTTSVYDLLSQIQAKNPSPAPSPVLPPTPPPAPSPSTNTCPPCLPTAPLTPDALVKKALELPYNDLLEALSKAHVPQFTAPKNLSTEATRYLDQLALSFKDFEKLLKETLGSKTFADKDTNQMLTEYMKDVLIEMATSL